MKNTDVEYRQKMILFREDCKNLDFFENKIDILNEDSVIDKLENKYCHKTVNNVIEKLTIIEKNHSSSAKNTVFNHLTGQAVNANCSDRTLRLYVSDWLKEALA